MPKNISEVIREISEKSMPFVAIGNVLETEPLRVQLIDDLGVLLSAQSLIIPSGKMPLKAGEQLYLLALNKGKIYFVLDRV